MKRSPIDKIKHILNIKHGAAAIEYGVIAIFVSGTVFVSSQFLESSGFAAFNAVALNAVTDTSPSGSTFKAD